MAEVRLINDAVHWFMNDLTSRIISDTGIPSDRYHLGKIILQSLRDAPDFVLQIDGATGKSETNRLVLERSVRCAVALKKLGLEIGDVMVLMAPNHLDLSIPFYAAAYLGIISAPIDRNMTLNELKRTLEFIRPKIVFCQEENSSNVTQALRELNMQSHIITFDDGERLSLSKFIENIDVNIEEFRATDYNPEETIGYLLPTSGSTGNPKAVACPYKNFAITGPYLWSKHTEFPTPTRLVMVPAPLQWLSAFAHFVFSPILRYTRLQSSLPVFKEHAFHLINTYRPSLTALSPTIMYSLIKAEEREKCDLSCFEMIMLGGSAVPKDLLNDLKKLIPKAEILTIYGVTEMFSMGFFGIQPPPGSCGQPVGCQKYRLINIDTKEDINQPNVPGELWVKGPGVFKEYYNNPTETKEAFAEGGWYKTGDVFYRDENWNFFFVERLKLLLKYKSFQVSPVEIETVIRHHPFVLDVAVTAVPDPECGDLPVACVVCHKGQIISAKEIKDMVKESLSDAKQLRGGVVFLNEMPVTSTTKVDRRKLKEIVLNMNRE